MIQARHSVLILLLLLLLGYFPYAVCGAAGEPPLVQLQQEFNQAVSRVRPAVVSIKARKKMAPDRGTASLWYESIGSGFIVDQRGFVLTNHHVVQDAQDIVVTLWRSRDNTEFTARIADADQSLDLALLKIDGNQPFLAAELGDSDRVKVGDWVLCVGSPFGFEHSVTMGVISDTRRDLSINGVSYKDMIQTDAVINQGNSGGAMLDIDGRVIGVGTAIYAPDGTSTGVSFGIPINRARHFLTRITGAMITAAATAPAKAPAKEPVNLNEKKPNDAIHKEFADCTQCHTILKKIVASIQAAMPHPPLGPCDQCHILVNDPVIKGPVTVAASQPLAPLAEADYSVLFTKVVLKVGLLTLAISVAFSMLGVGGGFLYLPILLACGIDFHTASASSVLMLMAAQLSGLYVFFKSGLVDLRLAVVLEPPTMVGALLGGLFSNSFDPVVLQIMFACMLFLAGYVMMQERSWREIYGRRCNAGSFQWQHDFRGHTYTIDLLPTIPLTFAIGFLGGMLSILGVGGGFLKVPMMVVMLGIPMQTAVATSALMVPITGLVDCLGHSMIGQFDPRLAITLCVVTAIGAQIGSKISVNAGNSVLRFMFSFILSLVGLWMILGVMF